MLIWLWNLPYKNGVLFSKETIKTIPTSLTNKGGPFRYKFCSLSSLMNTILTYLYLALQFSGDVSFTLYPAVCSGFSPLQKAFFKVLMTCRQYQGFVSKGNWIHFWVAGIINTQEYIFPNKWPINYTFLSKRKNIRLQLQAFFKNFQTLSGPPTITVKRVIIL